MKNTSLAMLFRGGDYTGALVGYISIACITLRALAIRTLIWGGYIHPNPLDLESETYALLN